MSERPPMDDFEPIASDIARQRIDEKITETLGEGWDAAGSPWMIVHDGDTYVRLTNRKINLDFQCDLLGEVTVTEQEIHPLQVSGRLVAWSVLLASLFLAFVIASLAGVFTP